MAPKRKLRDTLTPASSQVLAAFGLADDHLWQRTFHSLPDLIALLDCEHRIVRVNRAMAQKLGQTPDGCVGLFCYQCIHGTKAPPEFCPHMLALADGQEHVAEVHVDRWDADYLVTVTPLCDESGRTIGSVHVARDITQQKKAQELLRRLLEAGDHERHLISAEIHDGLAQQLAGALLQFEACNHLREAEPARADQAYLLGVQLVREGHAEARRLIGGLRPLQFAPGGLVAAIECLVEELARRHCVKIQFRGKSLALNLPPMLENTIFRIVQECLANACRHSRSKRIKVELAQHDDQLRVEVRDWGIGFNADRVPQGHFGLEGIHERAKVFGGHAVITSRPHKGTDIVVELPLPAPVGKRASVAGRTRHAR